MDIPNIVLSFSPLLLSCLKKKDSLQKDRTEMKH